MRVLLVRHAVALHRRDWSRSDHLRPLAVRGRAQASALVGLLAPYGVEQILSSPWLRCIETAQPLAARLGLPVVEETLLGEGQGAAAARLVDASASGTVLMCSHGDVLPELFSALTGVPVDWDLPWSKGAIWVVEEGEGGEGRRTTYLPAPA